MPNTQQKPSHMNGYYKITFMIGLGFFTMDSWTPL